MKRSLIGRALVAALGCGTAFGAQALNWDYSGVNITLDTRITASTIIRTESRDSQLIGIANGGSAYSVNADDGDLAFGKGDIAQASQRISSALTATYGDFGLFLRGQYLYDPVLQQKNFFDPADFGAGHQYPDSTRLLKNRIVQNHVGSDGTVLDAYVYGNFDISGHSLNIKVGRQVINWGESTLVLNGLNSILAFDGAKADLAAFDLDEVVAPSANVLASLSLTENVSVEGWYQLAWERTITPAAGTFFATNDFVDFGGNGGNIDFGRGGEYLAAGSNCVGGNNPGSTTCVPFGGSVPRGDERTPRNGGQYGGAVHFFIPELRDIDLAFYAANYHSRLPSISAISVSNGNVDAGTGRYFNEYPEDVHLFGASFNLTLPGGIALQGEYSYKPNVPLQIDDAEEELTLLGAPSQLNPATGATIGNQYIRGYRRHKVSQFDLGATKIFAPSTWLGYDQLLVIGETALTAVHDLEDQSVLRYEGPGTFLLGNAQQAAFFGVPQQQRGFATPISWGYKIVARATYNNVISGLSVEPSLRWDHDVRGVTPAPLSNFTTGTRVITGAVGFRYLSAYSAQIAYTSYFGGGQGNLLRDRDHLSLAVKYSF